MTSPNGRGDLSEGEETVSDSGWVTTKRAAAALGVATRTVRDYIRSGKLTGRPEGEGVEKTWYVSIDSIYALREERRQKARGGNPADRRVEEALTDDLAAVVPGELAAEDAAERGGSSASPLTPPDHTEILREALLRLDTRAAEVGDLRARLELTAQAESSLREALEREQVALERERERADSLEQENRELQEEARRPWYKRLFGSSGRSQRDR